MLQGPWSSVQRSATWIISLLWCNPQKKALSLFYEWDHSWRLFKTHMHMIEWIPHILKKDMLRKTRRSNLDNSEFKKNTRSTTARTSSENVTSRFCYNFSIIQSHYACKMCSNYPGIKLEPALHRKLKICHDMVTSSAKLQNRSFQVTERTRTSAKYQKWKMHVQSVQTCCCS